MAEQRQREEGDQQQRHQQQRDVRDAVGPVRRLPAPAPLAGTGRTAASAPQNTLMRSGSSFSLSGEPTASDCSDR